MKYREFDFLRMCPAEREALAAEIDALAEQVRSVWKYEFIKRYTPRGVRSCRVCTIYDETGALVGYQFVAAIDVTVAGRDCTVIRSCVTKCRQRAPSKSAFDGFGARTTLHLALKAKLRGRETWVVGGALAPVTYHVMAKHFDVMIPSARGDDHPVPMDFFLELREAAGFGPATSNPFLGKGEIQLDVTDEERASWAAREEPAVRRYLETCPEYGNGQMLVFAVPIVLRNVLSLLARFVGLR